MLLVGYPSTKKLILYQPPAFDEVNCMEILLSFLITSPSFIERLVMTGISYPTLRLFTGDSTPSDVLTCKYNSR